jgi:hypothetical protein
VIRGLRGGKRLSSEMGRSGSFGCRSDGEEPRGHAAVAGSRNGCHWEFTRVGDPPNKNKNKYTCGSSGCFDLCVSCTCVHGGKSTEILVQTRLRL